MLNRKERRTRISTSPVQTAKNMGRLALSALFLAVASATPAFAAVNPPSAPNLTDNSDSGGSYTDNITNINQPIFTGTGVPLSIVRLYVGQTEIGLAIVPPSGVWTVGANLKLSEGQRTITAKQTVGGVESGASSPLNIVIDTVAPTTSKPDLTAASDHGIGNSDNYTDTRTPTFQGTGTPGSTVSLYNATLSNDASIGSAVVSAQGNWTATAQTPFPTGTHGYQVAVRARDAAGNSSAMSSVLAIIVDTDIPANPKLPNLIDASDSGTSQTDNVTNIDKPTFTVKAESYSTVKLYRFAAKVDFIGSAIADVYGTATIKPQEAIPEGYFHIYAEITDQGGNASADGSPEFLLEIDKQTPEVANKPGLDPGSNSASPYDTVTNDNTPIINGHIYAPYDVEPANLTVTFFAGVFTYTVKSPVTNGNFSVTAPELPDGVYDVTVTNTDKAGNISVSPPLKLTVDTNKPIVAITEPGINATLTALPSISGTATDYLSGVDKVSLLLQRKSDGKYWVGSVWNAGVFTLDTTVASGEWTRSAGLPSGANLTAGEYTIAALVSDKAGNQGNAIVRSFMVDGNAPTVAIKTPTNNQSLPMTSFYAIAGSATDNVAVTQVLIKLFRTRNGVTTYWNGTSFGAAPVQIPVALASPDTTNTSWALPISPELKSALDFGSYSVVAYGKDGAGNTSAAIGSNFTLYNDITAPVPVISTPTQNQSLLITSFGSITGTASDNGGVSQVLIKLFRTRNGVTTYWNGTSFGATQVQIPVTLADPNDVITSWSFAVSTNLKAALDSGPYFLAAYAKDTNGNLSGAVGRNFSLTAPSAIQAPSSSFNSF